MHHIGEQCRTITQHNQSCRGIPRTRSQGPLGWCMGGTGRWFECRHTPGRLRNPCGIPGVGTFLPSESYELVQKKREEARQDRAPAMIREHRFGSLWLPCVTAGRNVSFVKELVREKETSSNSGNGRLQMCNVSNKLCQGVSHPLVPIFSGVYRNLVGRTGGKKERRCLCASVWWRYQI